MTPSLVVSSQPMVISPLENLIPYQSNQRRIKYFKDTRELKIRK
jgi:hypothetical protein